METRFRNPHQRAIVTLAGLVIFALLATLAIGGVSFAGAANPALAWIGFVFFVILALMLTIIWLMGLRQARRARNFLQSDRPLLRWTYSTAEWQLIRETIWQGERGDWKIQWGCLTLLLGLAGMLTGVMLGMEGGILDAITQGLIGLALGSLAGGALGALVAGGNFLGARQAYQREEPGQVALGPNEIYFSDDYFAGDGVNAYIQGIAIHHGGPATLEFQLIFPPRPRMPRQEQWVVPVPSRWVEKVEESLHVLAPDRED